MRYKFSSFISRKYCHSLSILFTNYNSPSVFSVFFTRVFGVSSKSLAATKAVVIGINGRKSVPYKWSGGVKKQPNRLMDSPSTEREGNNSCESEEETGFFRATKSKLRQRVAVKRKEWMEEWIESESENAPPQPLVLHTKPDQTASSANGLGWPGEGKERIEVLQLFTLIPWITDSYRHQRKKKDTYTFLTIMWLFKSKPLFHFEVALSNLPRLVSF